MRSLVIGLTVLTAFSFGDVLLTQDFDSDWTTAAPPLGWRIFYTPPEGSDDWHRQEPRSSPWLTSDSCYAAIFWNLYPGTPPDSLLTEPLDCSGYKNVKLYVTTLFNRQLANAYTAVLAYSTDGGSSFTVLRDYYEQDVDSVKEVFDLPDARNQTNVVIAWVHSGDLANIKWWCIDDVRVEADPILDFDIACQRIQDPGFTILPGDLTPRCRFLNNGLQDQVAIPVACSLYDNLYNGLAEWNDIIVSLPAGESVSVSFALPFSVTEGHYYIKFWCAALLDEDRFNDTLDRKFEVTYVENLSYCSGSPGTFADWPVGHYGWGVRFNAPAPYPLYLESAKVYLDCPANPQYSGYQLAVFKEASGGGPGEMYWKSPVLYGADGWNSVFMADTGEQLVIPGGEFYLFYLQVGEPPECPRLGVDRTLNNPDRYWQYRAGAFQAETPSGDLMLRASINHAVLPSPIVDVRTLFVDEPWYDFVQRPYNESLTPRALIENLGTTDVPAVVVTCFIFGQSNVLRYRDALTIDVLPSGADSMITFRPWTPEVAERCSVIVQTQTTVPSPVPQNDDKRFTVEIVKGVHTGASNLKYGWIDSDTTDGPTYDWIDTANADVAIATGDEARIFVPIGFKFPYYDTTYQYVYVCTNGWMALGDDQGTNESLPSKLPTPLMPNRCPYPWWDNLAVGPQYGGGRVYFKNEGTPPNRRFTVIWQDAWRVRPDGDTSGKVSFEVALHENGSILFQYSDVTAGDLSFDNGRYAGIGLENKDGSDGLCYLYARPPMSAAVNDLGNRLSSGRAIRFSKIFRDAAALRISIPEQYVFPGEVTPVAEIQNAGSVRDTIKVYLRIRPTPGPYEDSVIVADVGPGDSTSVTFRPCTLALGTYAVVCSTAMRNDAVDSNNVVSKVVVASPWVQREDIPPGWARRRIKNAALAYAPTTHKLYAMKGSSSNEFWNFDLATGKWDSLRSMPRDSSGRKARDGCDITFDPLHGDQGYLWAIKGGGVTDFYAYDIAANTWLMKHPVLVNFWYYRPPRKGAALAFVPDHGLQGTVYCLVGNNTNYMYCFDVATNLWSQSPDVPFSSGNLSARCKAGSDMVFDGGSLLYVMRGSNTLDVFAYSPLTNAWEDTLNPTHLLGPRLKKVKSGASMAYLDHTIYILKGGNTQEFWSCNVAGQDSWVQRSNIPISIVGRHRKVKRGSAMVAVDSTIFCLKGSYSNEFWEYKPTTDTAGTYALGPKPVRTGVMAGLAGLPSGSEFTADPNPTRYGVIVNYALPRAAHARLTIYDRTGRLIRTLLDTPALPGRHSIRWDALDNSRRRVVPGVYILRLESGTTVLTRKLVVQD